MPVQEIIATGRKLLEENEGMAMTATSWQNAIMDYKKQNAIEQRY